MNKFLRTPLDVTSHHKFSCLSSLKKLASQTAVYGLSSMIGRMLNYLLVPIYTRVFLTGEY
jgi:hypothetical protein